MKNLVVIKLNGGLGNQMFQYALAHVVARTHSSEILLDKGLFKLTEKKPGHTPREFELDVFGIDHATASLENINYFEKLSFYHKIKRELHLNFPQMCYEKDFSFDVTIKHAAPPVYLRGFFQSFKYFEEDEEVIRRVFKFPEKRLDEENLILLENIRIGRSVSVHVRRGDYVQDKITSQVHGTCSREYYDQAISKILKHNEEVEFFFFSDDIEWVVQEFKNLPVKKTFVGSNMGRDSWKDMLLMSNCTHNIIANSSFSWWAAWLNRNESKKVFAPKRWFQNPEIEKFTYDLIPESWIRI